MSRIFFPVYRYLDEISKLHSLLDKTFKEATFFSLHHLPYRIEDKRKGYSFQVYCDFNEAQPENYVKSYLIYDNYIVRFVRLDIPYVALFPVYGHSRFDKGAEMFKGITYSQIQQWKQCKSKIFLNFKYTRISKNDPEIIFDVENIPIPNNIDDIGLPISNFPDIKVLRIIELPTNLMNHNYSLVGKNYYAPLTSKKSCYCVLFAEKDNKHDKNAIKILRWFPQSKSKLLKTKSEIVEAKKTLENVKIRLEELKNRDSFYFPTYQQDIDRTTRRIERLGNDIKILEAKSSIGNYFYELGYISRTENSELHSFMDNMDSRILFGKLENDKISIIGGLDIFFSTDFCFPLCLSKITIK